MAQGVTPGQTIQQVAMSDWRHIIQSLYPDLDHRTYCVPPVYFNRVPLQRATFAGQPVLVSAGPPCQSASPSQSTSAGATVLESDTRDDFAQQHVLQCLQKLGEKQQEPMFVISQLNYADYLNKPSYAQAAQQLPRPVDLPPKHKHGDFDILIIHRNYGIIIGEIKSVGLKDGELNITQAQSDAAVAKRVGKAVKQLNKSETVVKHLVSDIAPGLSVNKTIILPYVTSSQLQRVLCADRQLEQAVCQSVGAKDVTEAVQLCLCADQLSSRATPHDVTPATLSALTSWLQRRTSVDPHMSSDVYIDVLARIVGPATSICVHCVTPPRVEVRTLGEAVSELGDRLARVVLTPQQLDLLNRSPGLPMVCLVGPPGTGKSLVLVLVGLHWLRAGHDVLVASTWYGSLAVSRLVYHQLETTLREDPTTPSSAGTVRFLHFNLQEDETHEEAVIESLMTTTTRHTLHVIMDEAGFLGIKTRTRLNRIVAQLSARVPGFCLWAATLSDDDIYQGLKVEPLTVPLRSSPVIVREVAKGIEYSSIQNYSTSGTPSPSDGPSVITLRHEGGQHTGRWPVDCGQCGREAADVLRHLQVGVTGPGTNTSTNNPSTTSGNTATSPPPLRYRDVLMLTRISTISSHCGFVTELRVCGVPVRVISNEDDVTWERGVTEMAVARSDHVTVAFVAYVFGLERKVVVILMDRDEEKDVKKSREYYERQDRLYAMSRCTSQLVVVEVPTHAHDYMGIVQLRKSLSDSLKQTTELKEEVKNLRSTVRQLQKSIETSVKQGAEMESTVVQQREKLNDMEQYSRRESVRMYGVRGDSREESNEDCERKVLDIIHTKLGLRHVDSSRISALHRVGKPVSGKDRPVIVKFVSMRDKVVVMKERRKLKGSKIMIADDLTALNMQRLQQLRDDARVGDAWSAAGGRLFAKLMNDQVVEVKGGVLVDSDGEQSDATDESTGDVNGGNDGVTGDKHSNKGNRDVADDHHDDDDSDNVAAADDDGSGGGECDAHGDESNHGDGVAAAAAADDDDGGHDDTAAPDDEEGGGDDVVS